jgi:hypothetical protein
MDKSCPTFMSCKCVLIGPLGYFFTINSKDPYISVCITIVRIGLGGRFRGGYLLVHVGNRSVWSYDRFLIIGTLIFRQQTRIDKNPQRIIRIRQFKRKDFGVMVDRCDCFQLPSTSPNENRSHRHTRRVLRGAMAGGRRFNLKINPFIWIRQDGVGRLKGCCNRSFDTTTIKVV